jgi:hypothetical protein
VVVVVVVVVVVIGREWGAVAAVVATRSEEAREGGPRFPRRRRRRERRLQWGRGRVGQRGLARRAWEDGRGTRTATNRESTAAAATATNRTTGASPGPMTREMGSAPRHACTDRSPGRSNHKQRTREALVGWVGGWGGTCVERRRYLDEMEHVVD